MTKNKVLYFSFLFLALSTLFSCASTKVTGSSSQEQVELLSINQLCPDDFIWEEIEPGFFQTSFTIKNPGIKWHCVKVDLSNPKLKIVSGISASKKGIKVSKFAEKEKSVVAINTTPFSLQDYSILVGITKDNGKIISQPEKNYCALGFNQIEDRYQAHILEHQTTEEISKVESAYGGFYQILKNNQVEHNFAKTRRSRVSCGISSNKTELYLLVCTPIFSLNDRNGLTYQECAFILQSMGCTDAMQFDGGHSTSLCIYKKQVIKPLFQRKVPAMLGFITN